MDDNKESVEIKGKTITNYPFDFKSATTTYINYRYRSKNYKTQCSLDDTYEKIHTVPGLKTTLYHHQKTIVKAMIDLEDKRIINTIDNYTIKYDAAILSEGVGLGKTIDILSLILIKPMPRVKRTINLCISNKFENNAQTSYYRNIPSYSIKNTTSYITKKYKNIIKPNLILVGTSVLSQWVNAIQQFTDLRVFAVYNVRYLELLISMIVSGKVNNYDIILVKNGKISRPVELPFGLKSNHTRGPNMWIYGIISNIATHCWSRVIIDDFDSINLTKELINIPALFTWLVSSTLRHAAVKSKDCGNCYNNISDYYLYNNYNTLNLNMYNAILLDILNVRNDLNYIKYTNLFYVPKFYVYVMNNKNNTYIQLLRAIGDDQSNNVAEMLNSDSINTAADYINVKTKIVADIFQKILGIRYEQYINCIKVLDFIQKNINKTFPKIEYDNKEDNEKYTYTKKDLNNRVPILYNYPGIKTLLSESIAIYTENKETCGKAIERVKNNIRQGECPICLNSLVGADVVIIKCCSLILCKTCCVSTLNSKYANEWLGNCSNCRALLNIKDLIFLNNDFDLNAIIKDKVDDTIGSDSGLDSDSDSGSDSDSDSDVSSDSGSDVSSDSEKDISSNINSASKDTDADIMEKLSIENDNKIPLNLRSKINAIVDIIRRRCDIPEQKRVDINLDNLNKGTRVNNVDYIQPYTKTLIFSSYDESIEYIKTELQSRNIKCKQLCGTFSNISKAVDEFNNAKERYVLIANNIKYCAGLNLQKATDLIFLHRILNKNIETQVFGRCQRLGRTCQPRIHFLLYNNEYYSMKSNNYLRIMSDQEIQDVDNVKNK